MAATSVVLQNCLCFLVKKFGRIAARPLKSMIIDFYGVDELYEAKRQLLSDATSLNLDSILPHIPERRDGDSKAVRIADDLFTVITVLDENQKISSLPCYVADSPDAMPSPRLYEGDLSTLMKVIERMENEIKELNIAINIAMAAIAKDVRESVSVPQPTRSVIHSDVHTGVWANAQAGNPPSDGALMTSQDSHQLLGHPRPADHERSTRDWASIAVESTPIATCNRYSALATTTDDEDAGNTSRFTEVRSRRSVKRLRNSSSTQPKQQQQPVDTRSQRETQQQIQGGQRRRGRVMMTGKCGASLNQRFTAAKKIVRKAVFCVDNVDPSLAVNDLCQFVSSMNVKVISCYPAHPRRRRHETEPPTDRKAFRLCVNDTDRDRLLDDSKWPDSVVISEWYYIKPDDRRKATVAADEAAAVASVASDADDNTMLYSSGNDVERAEQCAITDHGVQS